MLLGMRKEEEKGGERKREEGEGRRDRKEETRGDHRRPGVVRKPVNPSAFGLTCGYFMNTSAHCAP